VTGPGEQELQAQLREPDAARFTALNQTQLCQLEEAVTDLLSFGLVTMATGLELARIRRASQLLRNGKPVSGKSFSPRMAGKGKGQLSWRSTASGAARSSSAPFPWPFTPAQGCSSLPAFRPEDRTQPAASRGSLMMWVDPGLRLINASTPSLALPLYLTVRAPGP
jgi:hypothetical protein